MKCSVIGIAQQGIFLLYLYYPNLVTWQQKNSTVTYSLETYIFLVVCLCKLGVVVEEVATVCTVAGGWLCEVAEEGGDVVLGVA